MNSPEPPEPQDGLHRFVITPDLVAEAARVSTDAPGAPADTGPEPSTPSAEPPSDERLIFGTDEESGDELSIDRELLEALPTRNLVIRDGVAGYIDATGAFVALDDVTRGTTSPADDPDSPDRPVEVAPSSEALDMMEPMDDEAGADPIVEQLKAIDGVASVVAIGDGSYALATEDPEAIEALASGESTASGIGPITISTDPLLALAADPYEPYQWAVDNTGDNLASVQNPAPTQTTDADVDGREAAAGPRGSGVVVAVIDSGVDFSHPDLDGRSWTNPGETCGNGVDDDGNGFVDDCTGWDFGYEDNVPWSPSNQDHGTHVAGIIAATADNGIGVAGHAASAEIMDLSVDGPGGISTSSVARAIRYAVDNGADVINMSLGTSPGTPRAAVLPMIAAVEHAAEAGVVVVVAAGNSNVNLGTSAVYPASIDAENMIVVGAATPAETKAGFSNYGDPVTLFAPGQLILSTVPGNRYVFMSGTSQASPMVAAAAAAVLEDMPGSTPTAVRDQLVGTADEIAAYAPFAANGVRLNSAAAVGIDADAAGVSVTIGGLAARTQAVTAAIAMSDPGGELDEPHHWEASLVAITSDGAFAVIDHPVTVDDADVTTDERGSVPLAPSQAAAAGISTELPDGTYALIVEAVLTADPTIRLGDAFISTFEVGEPDDEPDPAVTTTTIPQGSTTSTSIASAPTTTTVTTTPTTTPSTPNGPGQTTSSVPTNQTTTTARSGSTTQPAPGQTTAPATTSPSGGSDSTGGPTTTSAGGVQTTVAITATVPTPEPSISLPTTGTQPTTTTSATTTSSTAATPTTAPSTPSPAPSPTAPSTSAPTTNAPPTSSPGSGQDGWAFYGLDPSTGPQDGGTMVSMIGRFPEAAYVWFGDQPGDVVFQTESWILVIVPGSAVSGPVDVTLRTVAGGTVLTAPNRYNYIGSGPPSPGTPTTAPTPSPTDGPTPSTTATTSPGSPTTVTTTLETPGTGANPSTSAPRETTTTTQGSSQTTDQTPDQDQDPDQDNDPDDEETGSSNRQDRATAGQPIDLGNGLRGAPLSGLGDLAGIPRCTSDPCRVRQF